MIDAHSQVPNATAIDAYVAAMSATTPERVLLGVGGLRRKTQPG